MSTDEDYSSFLDKANEDPGSGPKASSKSKSASTKAVDTVVPGDLDKVDAYYTTESDEPFEPVSLKFSEGHLPSADEFKDLVGHGGEVSEISVNDFDPKGDYKDVVDTVKKAGSKSVKVFRIDHESTRAEYYVVSLDKKAGRIVGLKAKAVES